MCIILENKNLKNRSECSFCTGLFSGTPEYKAIDQRHESATQMTFPFWNLWCFRVLLYHFMAPDLEISLVTSHLLKKIVAFWAPFLQQSVSFVIVVVPLHLIISEFAFSKD